MFSFKFELIIYTFLWISSVLYSIYSFAISSEKFFQDYQDEYSDFIDGWFGRKKDISDYEWETIKYLIKELFPCLFIHSIGIEFMRMAHLAQFYQKLWQIFIGISVIIFKISFPALCLIAFQPMLFALSSLANNKKIIWFCSLICIYTNSLFKYSNESFQTNLDQQQIYLVILTIFWMNLKCTSYNLDNLDQFQLIDFLAYCFYLPTIFTGPFINYHDFNQCYSKVNSKKPLVKLLITIPRFIFWMVFMEISLHFIYVNATSFQPELVRHLNGWSLYGYGYTMGQFFHMKYLVLYGLATTIAEFDGIPVPTLPKCIGRIHLYSDMWKYFDVGLHRFLLSYIYIPINRGMHTKFMASFFCFAFVYIWHGVEDYILIWTFLNYTGVVIENLSSQIYERARSWAILRKLGPAGLQRLVCLFSSPLLAMSAVSNFYFFARAEIGGIFLKRLLSGPLLTNTVLFLSLYCCCQCSSALREKSRKI